MLIINQDNIAMPDKGNRLNENARILCGIYFYLSPNSTLGVDDVSALTETGRAALEDLVFNKVITSKKANNKTVYKGSELAYNIGRAVRTDPDFPTKSRLFTLVGSSILNRNRR